MKELIELDSFPIRTTLNKLLEDKTTGNNIMWFSDSYEEFGSQYGANKQITSAAVIGLNSIELQPRIMKNFQKQQERTRKHAEVFTPAWICCMMNNFADEEWFGRKNVFNIQNDKTWTAVEEKIEFPKRKNWKQYVDSRRLEITCGEAPYLVSRYDATTGEIIDIKNRIGILDRKLRIVNENTSNEKDWIKWATRAFQSVYGYEYQGDSLLIARINLLMTFVEYTQDKWKRMPTEKELQKTANIISWNLWQMNGLSQTIPLEAPKDEFYQYSLLDFMDKFKVINETENIHKKDKIQKCKIYDWRANNSLFFKTDEKGAKRMKFDFCIGNPPYQEVRESTKDMPVYNIFMDAAYEIADVVELITPARFLFRAGATPKLWNNKILNDKHFKVLKYQADSSKIFPNTDIKGGIAIHYRNTKKVYAAIGVFSAFQELNAIRQKIDNIFDFVSLNTIMYPYSTYTISDKLWLDFPKLKERVEYISKNRNTISPQERKGELSNLRIITTNIFELLPNLFFDKKPNDGQEYCCLMGRKNNKRIKQYILKKYIDTAENYEGYKVILPKSNGSGALGEVLSTPLIGTPLIGYTQSFLGIGNFYSKQECTACFKYIKTKFARTALGILKITQDNPPEKWKYVPLQDFTENSDIDWSVSVAEIDKQLYKKYNLNEEEINFIETKVKEME